jgi:hypothetical protein
MPSPQRETANRLIAAFNAQDTESIISLRTPNCTRNFLPSSLNISPQSNSRYLAELNSLNGIFISLHLTVQDVIEDTEQRKIVMFVAAEGETVVGEYRNEYVWKMNFDEEARICEWVEYVDAGMVRDFFPRLKAEMARRAKQAEAEDAAHTSSS